MRVGLTGGIASGKSTVAAMLAELGALVIDADRLAAEVTAPGGPAFEPVVARFGDGILAADGRIDRQALGRIVFSDEQARRDLEAIVHPAVRDAAARIAAAHVANDPTGAPQVVIFDAALLVETGAYRDHDRLIVTSCSRETQIARLLERDGMARAEAEARIAAQAPLARKLALADFVVDTEGSLEATRARVTAIFAELQAAAAGGADPRRC